MNFVSMRFVPSPIPDSYSLYLADTRPVEIQPNSFFPFEWKYTGLEDEAFEPLPVMFLKRQGEMWQSLHSYNWFRNLIGVSQKGLKCTLWLFVQSVSHQEFRIYAQGWGHNITFQDVFFFRMGLTFAFPPLPICGELLMQALWMELWRRKTKNVTAHSRKGEIKHPGALMAELCMSHQCLLRAP